MDCFYSKEEVVHVFKEDVLFQNEKGNMNIHKQNIQKQINNNLESSSTGIENGQAQYTISLCILSKDKSTSHDIIDVLLGNYINNAKDKPKL